jgi:hypothetical protein
MSRQQRRQPLAPASSSCSLDLTKDPQLWKWCLWLRRLIWALGENGSPLYVGWRVASTSPAKYLVTLTVILPPSMEIIPDVGLVGSAQHSPDFNARRIVLSVQRAAATQEGEGEASECRSSWLIQAFTKV